MGHYRDFTAELYTKYLGNLCRVLLLITFLKISNSITLIIIVPTISLLKMRRRTTVSEVVSSQILQSRVHGLDLHINNNIALAHTHQSPGSFSKSLTVSSMASPASDATLLGLHRKPIAENAGHFYNFRASNPGNAI